MAFFTRGRDVMAIYLTGPTDEWEVLRKVWASLRPLTR